MMTYVEVANRSDEWVAERMGSIGASEVYDATAKLKSGKGYTSKREELMFKKLVERLGIQSKGFTSPAMQHGIDNEANARTYYEFFRNVSVKEVGIFKHNRLAAHASPDGVLNSVNVGVEIKCMQPVNHLKTLLTGEIEDKYIAQMQWQMACAGFEAVEFIAYSPVFPLSSQLFIKRVHRDAAMIDELESEVEKFLSELDQMEAKFRSKYAD